MTSIRRICTGPCLLLIVLVFACACSYRKGVTERASVSTDGVQANKWTFRVALSGNGKFVAFFSEASNLVANDTNNTWDIFVRDLEDGVTLPVSVNSAGNLRSGDFPKVNFDGRYVCFSSGFRLANDDNAWPDIFLRDMVAGVTERISLSHDGSVNNEASYLSDISDDGTIIAFQSRASNLVPGDGNAASDVFVRDRVSGNTTRVSVASDGSEGNGNSGGLAISGDGRYIAFVSSSTNLVEGDTNGVDDIFVHDRIAHTTTRATVNSAGVQTNQGCEWPSISQDGKVVAFHSSATNLATNDVVGNDVFVHFMDSGITHRVSTKSDGSSASGEYPSISGNGRYVAYHTWYSFTNRDANSGDDIYLYDLLKGTHHLVSEHILQIPHPSGDSHFGDPSDDGSVVAFRSASNNLIYGDTNGVLDAYVRHRFKSVPLP